MRTVLTTSPEEAAEFIKRGGVVAFPTETVYGLGADIFDENAIRKIFEAKKRPDDNPLIAHIGEIGQIRLIASHVPEIAQKYIDAFFPGPLTLVLPKSSNVSMIATARLETIGVRMPRNEVANRFLRACKTPVVAPSANISGRPSPTTWEAVYEDLDGRIDCILQGEMTEIGLESTVVDCTADVPMILRTGAISLEQLQAVVQETRVYERDENEKPRSPGMKHKHYAPNAKVVLADSKFQIPDSKSRSFIGLVKPEGKFELVKVCDSVENYAHSVFAFFRECDRRKIETIYCETVEETGIGVALMDRLRRSADNAEARS
jgi:L-threonylcarbamoyladenylate synthase